MPTFVLLHGAFRGGWSWEPVVQCLQVRGHAAHAPDLLGAAPGHPREAPISLAATLDDLESHWRREGWADVVLAGHSQGGLVARAASQRLADRIRLLAYLDAPVPAHGQRAVDLAAPGAPPPPDGMDPAAWIAPTPLGEASGVPPEIRMDANRRLVPQSVALALDPVVLDDPAALALPEAYAFCSDTPTSFPCWHTRARLDEQGQDYVVLDAPHDAPLAAPDAVADWLDALLRYPRNTVPLNGTHGGSSS